MHHVKIVNENILLFGWLALPLPYVNLCIVERKWRQILISYPEINQLHEKQQASSLVCWACPPYVDALHKFSFVSEMKPYCYFSISINITKGHCSRKVEHSSSRMKSYNVIVVCIPGNGTEKLKPPFKKLEPLREKKSRVDESDEVSRLSEQRLPILFSVSQRQQVSKHFLLRTDKPGSNFLSSCKRVEWSVLASSLTPVIKALSYRLLEVCLWSRCSRLLFWYLLEEDSKTQTAVNFYSEHCHWARTTSCEVREMYV